MGTAWTPERKKKFMETVERKRQAQGKETEGASRSLAEKVRKPRTILAIKDPGDGHKIECPHCGKEVTIFVT